ncbi:MAG: CoA transferase [Chloroflexota bacterium]
MVKVAQPVLLSDLHVLDLTMDRSFLCGRILAELGARVTRIELPSSQTGTAHVWDGNIDDGLRLVFERAGGWVRCVNLESASGRRVFGNLAASADCLIETFRPGYLESLGLGFKVLSAVNPRLIVVSITGFGQSGPRRDWVSCGLTVAALGGQMYVAGRSDKSPLKLCGDQAEHLGVLFIVNGLLLALQRRNRTGCGQHVDISLQECVTAALDHVLPRYFGEGVVAQRQGSLTWNGAFNVFRCRDGYFLASVPGDREALVEWMAGDGTACGPTGNKWRNPECRARNPGAIMSVIGRWIKGHTSKELFQKAQLMRLPWAPVLRPGELVRNQQLRSRGFFVRLRVGDSPVVVAPRALPFLVRGNPSIVEVGESQPHLTDASGLPLCGVRILDFTWVMAGPYATRLLADFGAEVIKVQTHRVPGSETANRTPYFKYWNRGKFGITLDMGHPEGIALARRLVRLSDVVIESFSPRVMDNWGLSWDVMQREKSDIIMVSMSAFGQTGPWRNYIAFGPTVHALSGLTYSMRYGRGGPVGPGVAFADHVAGLYASMAVMSALENRRRTGRGAFIDLSQFEAMCALTSVGQNSPVAAPYGVYPCRGQDSWCTIAVFGDDEWRRLCRTMKSPSLSGSLEFATMEARLQNRVRLDALISRWTSRLTAEEVMMRLQEARVCAGTVQSAQDLAVDEQLKARGFFVKLPDSYKGELVVDGTPLKLSDGRAVFDRRAPVLGEHNDYVYCDLLGMGHDELAGYIERGIIY